MTAKVVSTVSKNAIKREQYDSPNFQIGITNPT